MRCTRFYETLNYGHVPIPFWQRVPICLIASMLLTYRRGDQSIAGQIHHGISWDNVVRCRSGDAACASSVRELSHAPPMRLRSRDLIGCSRAVVSAMGTSRFDARARTRSARVYSRLSLREHSTSLAR